MKNASFRTILEDLKISYKFATKNVISYILAIIGVFIAAGILLVVVAAIVFVPFLFAIGGFEAFIILFDSFGAWSATEGVTIVAGIFLFALPFIAPIFVAIGALFGVSREIVESEGTTAEGVFVWFKRKFFSLAGGGIVLFLFIMGPIILISFGAVLLFGDQVLNIAFIGIGSGETLSPLLSALLMIWITISSGLMTMLFPAIIDGHPVIEATKRSIRMGIDYFDRVFGVWLANVGVILLLLAPVMVGPFTLGIGMPGLIAMGIYAIPMALILVFVALPAVSICLTRVYMILSADNDDLSPQESEDEGGPNFIGGL
ncbi:MAG: hypothetical protein KGD60_09245 [Candidatus Thorarchaeota archaeon]|nr:hypothetical protein [Candidatus Thorarchaeota archaeon]